MVTPTKVTQKLRRHVRSVKQDRNDSQVNNVGASWLVEAVWRAEGPVCGSEPPGVSHHQDEVDVAVDGGADSAIIVHKLLLGHLSIRAENQITVTTERRSQSSWRRENREGDQISIDYWSDSSCFPSKWAESLYGVTWHKVNQSGTNRNWAKGAT